jgi:heme/copper-type cytochrome/quinol oxidase subunit 2
MLTTHRTINIAFAVLGALVVGRIVAVAGDAAGGPRIIDVTADQDNRFKVPKQKEPVITMKVNEVAVLRITSRKGGEWDDKDGTIHTFTINALKDKGWNFRLKEGTQKFPVVAPAEPGTYAVECTVKCGKGHDDMKMKLVVTP